MEAAADGLRPRFIMCPLVRGPFAIRRLEFNIDTLPAQSKFVNQHSELCGQSEERRLGLILGVASSVNGMLESGRELAYRRASRVSSSNRFASILFLGFLAVRDFFELEAFVFGIIKVQSDRTNYQGFLRDTPLIWERKL